MEQLVEILCAVICKDCNPGLAKGYMWYGGSAFSPLSTAYAMRNKVKL